MATTTFGVGNHGLQIGQNSGTINFTPPQQSVNICRHRVLLTDPEVDRDTVKSVKGQRAIGTCEWISENQIYTSWLTGDSPCIWISGGPGRGKTMLSLFLIEEIERKAQNSGEMVIFYICNHQDEKRNSAVTILRGFIYQILTKRLELSGHVSKFFEDERKSDLVLASPQTLWDIFNVLLTACEDTICCLLDGLDEYDDESIRLFTRNLVDCFSSETGKPPNFRLIIVSRTLARLKTFPEVKLDPDNNDHTNSDIQKFVSQRTRELEMAVEGFNEIKEQVSKTLLERAEGTFLWIGFATDELSRKATRTQILDALNEIPRGLPAMYNRILSKTEEHRRPILSRMLRWVAVAMRPLTVDELAVGMAIDDTEQFSQQILLDHILMCGNILQIKNGDVGFVHQSVIDYLMGPHLANDTALKGFHINVESAHSEVTGVCIDYLEGSVLRDRSFIRIQRQEYSGTHPLFEYRSDDWVPWVAETHPWLDYCLENWFKHARSGSAKLRPGLILDRPFFKKRSTTRKNWLATSIYFPHGPLKGVEICGSSPLRLASSLGIESWAEKELGNGIKAWKWYCYSGVDTLLSLKNSPVYNAVKNDNQAIVKLLLDKGFLIKSYRAPMFLAVKERNEAMVRILLDKSSYSQSAMILAMEVAAWLKRYAIARLLLDWDARTSLVRKSTWTTCLQRQCPTFNSRLARKLWVAMKCRHPTIIPLLLDKIKNVNDCFVIPYGVDGIPFRGTLLMIAVKFGDTKTVKYLLKRGADINQRTKGFETALTTALSYEFSMPMMRLLLENGADIKNDPRAFLRAIEVGTEEVVRLLLEYGADINAEVHGTTPLYLAKLFGGKNIEKLLRELGATEEATSS